MTNKSRSRIFIISSLVFLLLIVVVSAQSFDRKPIMPLTPAEIISQFETGKIGNEELIKYANEGRFKDVNQRESEKISLPGAFSKVSSILKIDKGSFDLTVPVREQSFEEGQETEELAVSSAPETSGSFEITSIWGGRVNAVEEIGEIAFVGAGRRLVSIDITDIDLTDFGDLSEIDSLDLGNTVQDFVIQGDFAYVIKEGNSNTFAVVDISNPENLQLVWTSGNSSAQYSSWIHAPTQIHLYGNYVYILASDDLFVVDISNPEVPVVLGPPIVLESDFPSNNHLFVEDLTIAGDLAYVAAESYIPELGGTTALFQVYDLSYSDKLNPIKLANFPLYPDFSVTSHSRHIAFNGEYVYYITGHDPNVYDPDFPDYEALSVIDVSDPTNPFIASNPVNFSLISYVSDLQVDEETLYVIDYNWAYPYPTWQPEGLKTYDISKDPTSPEFLTSYKTHGSVYGARLFSQGRLWLFDEGEGLIAMNVNFPEDPHRIGGYYSPAEIREIVKDEDFIYASDEWNGLTILDVSNPHETPRVAGIYQTHDYDGEVMGVDNLGIALRDNLIYLAAGWAGIMLIDVSNPENPTLFSDHPYEPSGPLSQGLELDGDVLHLGLGGAGYNGLLLNVDATPGEIGVLGYILAGEYDITHLTTYQDITFSGYKWGMSRVENSDPYNPELLSYGSPDASDFFLDGSLLYVASHDIITDIEGLYIYDISNPLSPVLQSFYPVSNIGAVFVQDNFAYTIGNGNMLVLEVSDPKQPVPVAAAQQIGRSEGGFIVDENFAYVSTGGSENGLVIVEGSDIGLFEQEDLNHDGVVDGLDLAVVLGDWTGTSFYSPCTPYLPTDFDHNCKVNGGDLAWLLGEWTAGSER